MMVLLCGDLLSLGGNPPPRSQVSHIVTLVMTDFGFIECLIFIVHVIGNCGHNQIGNRNPMIADIQKNVRIAEKAIVEINDHGVNPSGTNVVWHGMGAGVNPLVPLVRLSQEPVLGSDLQVSQMEHQNH